MFHTKPFIDFVRRRNSTSFDIRKSSANRSKRFFMSKLILPKTIFGELAHRFSQRLLVPNSVLVKPFKQFWR
jgi:hypothetical protein